MLIKFKKNASEWFTFYADAFRNRLRRDLNLSDLMNIPEARKNIELVGDNNHTHYHDDRYLPTINNNKVQLEQEILKVSQDLINAINQLNDAITAEESARISADNALDQKINNLNNSVEQINKKVSSIFDSEGHLVYPNGNTLWIE